MRGRTGQRGLRTIRTGIFQKPSKARFRENGLQLDKERWEEKPQLEAANTENSSGEFYYKGRKEMRLQLKDERQIVYFLMKLNIICTLMRGKMILGKGVTAEVKSLNKEMGSSTMNTPTDNLQ